MTRDRLLKLLRDVETTDGYEESICPHCCENADYDVKASKRIPVHLADCELKAAIDWLEDESQILEPGDRSSTGGWVLMP